MAFCGECGARAEANERFCGACGKPLDDDGAGGPASIEGAGGPASIEGLAISCAGLIAVGDAHGRLELREADGRVIQTAALADEFIRTLAFTGDGRSLIVVCTTSVVVVGVPDLTVQRRCPLRLDANSAAVVRGEGTRVLHLAGGTLVESDLQSGQTVHACALPRPFTSLGARDEGVALLGNDEGHVCVVDPRAGAVCGSLELRGRSALMVTGLFVCPGNRLGLVATTDAVVHVIELPQGRVVTRLSGHTCNVFGLDSSSSGRCLFTGGGTGMLADADLFGEPHENSVRAWDAVTGKQLWSHDTGRSLAMHVRCSRDGNWLFLGMHDGGVRHVELPGDVSQR